MRAPKPGDCAEYYGGYISRVPGGDILSILDAQRSELNDFASSLEPARGDHRYGPKKWSIKEVIGHVNDIERLFAYRMLRIVRGDSTPMPGMEQDDWVASTEFNRRSLVDLAEEFSLQRGGFVVLARSITDAEWERRGKASGFDFTAVAVPYILAGHVIHHLGIVRERYLGEG